MLTYHWGQGSKGMDISGQGLDGGSLLDSGSSDGFGSELATEGWIKMSSK